MAENDKGNGLKPLHGVVLCSTSLGQEVRTRVAQIAIELGARHLLDLTKDVTHLIVGSVETPKYQFVAKNRPDVRVLSLSWLEAVRSAWMNAEDLDLQQLEQSHRYPTFGGLSICITGFTHPEERTKLEQLFRNNGAEYSGDLSKQISHLVVAAPSGAKYTHAKQWGIRCMSLKWVTQSLERGMVLDESLFDPLLPDSEQGKGAFVPLSSINTVPKKRTIEDAGSEAARKRKFRRTASARLETHSQDLWQDISGHDVAAAGQSMDQWSESAAQHVKSGSESNTPYQTNAQSATVEQTLQGQLFSGWHFVLLGFERERERKLQHVLRDQCGANVLQGVDELTTALGGLHQSKACLLVPHIPDLKQSDMPTTPTGVAIATEWWIERCIVTKQVISTERDRLSRPFWRPKGAPFNGLSITSTGLSSLDLRQLASVVELTGAKYEESLSAATSVLISATEKIRKEKAYYAQKHSIPIVKLDWLWASVDEGRVASFEAYRIIPSVQDCDPDKSDSRHSRQPTRQTASAARPSRHSPGKARQATRGPLVLDEHDDSGSLSGHHSPVRLVASKPRPLAERSPNASPKKRTVEKPSLEHVNPIQPASAIAVKSAEDLKANLTSLSNQLQQSRRESPASAVSQPLRRSKKLGRASSGILHRSASVASMELSHDGCLDLFDDEAATGGNTIDDKAPDSTQLGYEVPDAEIHRLQMAKRMGLSLTDDNSGTKVASLGTVKDAEHVSAHGVARARRTRTGR